MRLGMLDVGSNTVHLLVVDAEAGARPVPAAKHRTELRLLDHFADGDHLSSSGIRHLVAAINEARESAENLGVEDLAAFATSALREAANADAVLEEVSLQTGVALHILDGDDEAKLTFLAARRWFGWSAGRLLLVDIGGGSLELGVGIDEVPDHVASFPLGASRLTRDWLTGDPPSEEEVSALDLHMRQVIAQGIRPFAAGSDVDHAVGTSKTLRSLARIAGAAPYRDGPYVRRVLTRDQAVAILDKVAGMKAKDRAKLPGVSASRARHLVAGALIASTTMELLNVDELVICPWALREGVILTRLDWLTVV
jgi:exopolyphosphatase/guanosine-5'-triphosphate,3'-diphosphate pyrophosphatase